VIYLDYNATTPCAPEVVEAMLPYFTQKFGNAGSVTHAMGWTAQEAVKNARANIADHLQCEAEEIYFTSGATESCNLAIQGIYNLYNIKGREIICCTTEHKAVLDTYHFLEQQGAIVRHIGVDEAGHIDLEALEQAITDNTILLSIMFANNETGVIHDIRSIGELARKKGVLFFCDATQAVGKLPVSLSELPIDAMAFSGHKLYGPKGIGGLFLRRKKPRVSLQPLFYGGGQERNRRSGTLNVPGIVGMSKAFSLFPDNQAAIAALRDRLEAALLAIRPGFMVNGDTRQRLPHVTNIAFCGVKAEKLLSRVNHELCFSLGSACTAAQQGPSHVLQSMFDDARRLEGSVRFSLGRYTTGSEITETITLLRKALNNL